MPTRMIVVGGGLFGVWSSLVLASRGSDVILLEQSDALLSRASTVNQARLHTGLHYPRSLSTAKRALANFERFCAEFPDAIHRFDQIYAVARHGSSTTGVGYERFIDRLGISAHRLPVSRWFNESLIEAAWRVEEPSFDVNAVLEALTHRIATSHRITVRTGVVATGARVTGSGVSVQLRNGELMSADGLVIATYAGINAFRRTLDLEPLPLAHEVAEVTLGRVDNRLEGTGFTVMDGQYWSMMPYGHSGRVSLTSVGLTPSRRATGLPVFSCQDRREDCSPIALADCSTCDERPRSSRRHKVQQVSAYLKASDAFTPESSVWTIKTILKTADVDDARPTVVLKEPCGPVWTVFSGKVSTIFDIERGLA